MICVNIQHVILDPGVHGDDGIRRWDGKTNVRMRIMIGFEVSVKFQSNSSQIPVKFQDALN
jgi:hypothetical protein